MLPSRCLLLLAASFLLTAGAHAAPPATLRLERTLGDARFQEDAEIQTLLTLDANRVATMSDGTAVKVWERESGKLLAWTLADKDDVFMDVLALPDSDQLVLTTLSKGLLLWSPGQPPEPFFAPIEDATCAAWHPAGFIATAGGGSEVCFVDPNQPKRVGRMVTDQALRTFAFSPDGKRLVGVRDEDGNLGAWNVPPLPNKNRGGIKPTPTLELRPAVRSPILNMSPSPDGGLIVLVEENNGLSLLETAPGLRERWHVDIADMGVGRTAWSPDGSWIALSSGDGNVYRVDPKDGSRRLFAALPGDGNEAVAFPRDGKTLFTGTNGGRLCIFDAGTGQLLNPKAGKIHDTRANMEEGVAVLTRNDSAVWIDQVDGILEIPLDGGPSRQVVENDGIALIGRAGTNIVMAFSEKGFLLDDTGAVTGTFEDNKTLVLQTVTELLKPLDAKSGPAFHAWLFQNADGFDRENDLLGGFDFSPDGRTAVFFDSLDHTLALWDLVGDRRVPLPLPEEFYPEEVGFSPVDPNTFHVTDAETLLVFDLVPATVEGVITPEEFTAALKRLSSGRFREREDGTRRLKAGGATTLALLQTAATPEDPEVAERLDEVREYLQSAGAPSVSLRTADLSQLSCIMMQILPLADGLLVATRPEGVMLSRLRDGVIEILSFLETPSQPVILALSRDGRRVITLHANGTVSVFRLE